MTDTNTANGNTTFRAVAASALVVDDNEMCRMIAFRMLGHYGVAADTAVSGAEALEAVQAADYDIVFMDHMMHGMDGVQAAVMIRRLGGKCGDVPIIAVTANATEDVREKFLASGLNDCLTKPLALKELGEILRMYLPREKIKIGGRIGGEAEAVRPEAAPRVRLNSNNSANAERSTDPEVFWQDVGGIGFINAEAVKPNMSAERYREMIGTLYDSLPADSDELKKLLADNDLSGFAASARNLKTALATLGADRLADEAAELEHSAKIGCPQICETKTPPFLENMRILRMRLGKFCAPGR